MSKRHSIYGSNRDIDSDLSRSLTDAALHNTTMNDADDFGKAPFSGAGTAILHKEDDTAIDRAKTHDGDVEGGSDSVRNAPASHEHTSARTSTKASESYRK